MPPAAAEKYIARTFRAARRLATMVAFIGKRQTTVPDDMHDQSIGTQPGDAQPAIRVVLGEMPEVLLRLVARAIHERQDMVLIGEGHDPIGTLQMMRDNVDVVILGSDTVADCPGICSHLLSEYPHLKIVLLSHRENTARAYWLGLRQQPVAADTMQALLHDVSQVSQIDAMD